MEGIGLDNMLGAEEVERLFSNPIGTEEAKASEPQAETEVSAEEESGETTEQTAEVDFSDLIGSHPESVGSEKNTEGNGETPKSNNDSGTPQNNLFSSIAKALRDEGVFPDLSDETISETTDAASLRKMFDDEVTKSLDERQQRLEKMIQGGASSEELQEYQKALNLSHFLEDRETYETLIKEGEDGETLRKQVMYQDYINRGFKHEKAVRMIEKSVEEGTDIEDAKEAFESCKDFYKERVEGFQQEIESRKQQRKADEEKQYSNLKKRILETENFYDGVKVDKATRQRAYDALTKPVFKDENGNYLTTLQKYQRENPMEFMENVAILYSLTDGFKNIESLTKGKVQAGLKKGFAAIENVLNTTKRNSDGSLNLGNAALDESEREKWTLAM